MKYTPIAYEIDLRPEGFVFDMDTSFDLFDWEKVREIYKLGLKHGMKLAAISGVNGVHTDEDIKRVKELALEKIKQKNEEKYSIAVNE